MATCPECGESSREKPEGFEIKEVLVVPPLLGFSLAGAQLKASARKLLQFSHSCGWKVVGTIQGTDFVPEVDSD